MKTIGILFSLLSVVAWQSLSAENSVKIDDVHLCCKACERGVASAVATVEGATAVADRENGTVVITAPDKKTLRKGVNAMMRAGFYGNSTDSTVKMRDISGAEDKQVKSVKVTGVHLCCGGCVDAVVEALDTVKGVSGNTAEKKVDSFEVVGDFNAKEMFAALNKAGFAGKVGK